MIHDGDYYSNFIGASKSGDKDFLLDIISDELSNLLSDPKSRSNIILFLKEKKNIPAITSESYNEEIISPWIDLISKDDLTMVFTSKSIFEYHGDSIDTSGKQKERVDFSDDLKKTKSKITDVSKMFADFFKESKESDKRNLIDLTTIKSNNKSPNYAKHGSDNITAADRKAKEAKKEKRNHIIMTVCTVAIIAYYLYKKNQI